VVVVVATLIRKLILLCFREILYLLSPSDTETRAEFLLALCSISHSLSIASCAKNAKTKSTNSPTHQSCACNSIRILCVWCEHLSILYLLLSSKKVVPVAHTSSGWLVTGV
jgi:hypothetical protein